MTRPSKATPNGTTFELEESYALLVFDEEELAGLEVRCRTDTPLSVFLEFQQLAASGSDDPAAARPAFELFADAVLDSWNLTRKGKPVPPDRDGVLSLPPRIATRLVVEWSGVVGGVDEDLEPEPPSTIMSAAGSDEQTGA
jgi:hypothetical protein